MHRVTFATTATATDEQPKEYIQTKKEIKGIIRQVNKLLEKSPNPDNVTKERAKNAADLIGNKFLEYLEASKTHANFPVFYKIAPQNKQDRRDRVDTHDLRIIFFMGLMSRLTELKFKLPETFTDYRNVKVDFKQLAWPLRDNEPGHAEWLKFCQACVTIADKKYQYKYQSWISKDLIPQFIVEQEQLELATMKRAITRAKTKNKEAISVEQVIQFMGQKNKNTPALHTNTKTESTLKRPADAFTVDINHHLRNIKITHLPISYKVGQELRVLYVELNEIIKNPIQMLGNIVTVTSQQGISLEGMSLMVNALSETQPKELRKIQNSTTISEKGLVPFEPGRLQNPSKKTAHLSQEDILVLFQWITTFYGLRELSTLNQNKDLSSKAEIIEAQRRQELAQEDLFDEAEIVEDEEDQDELEFVQEPINPAMGRADLEINLDKHKEKFYILLAQLKLKTDELIQKGQQNGPLYSSKYAVVSNAAMALNTTLDTAADRFFNQAITKEMYIEFKTTCEEAINAAHESFKQHRNNWGIIPQILKALIGLILSIPIGLPALVIGKGTGYSDTFFRRPKTDSEQKLTIFQSQQSQLFDEIENEPELALDAPTVR